MICLTGDIYHSRMRTGNQKAYDIAELQVAQRYLQLLEEANVKVTFFVTGKAFADEWHNLKWICDHRLVSIQGHTYYGFLPEWWHRGWKKLTGNYNGPSWYQRWDVQKTIAIIQAKTGRRITCWRNHMYMHGLHTDRILADCGIRLCSDGVDRNAIGPRWISTGLYDFPINVIPDQEHLYHAERTPEWVDGWVKRYNWSDDFGSKSYHIEEWTELVLECLRLNEQRGAISNMIIHPITMYLCDRFKSFEKILAFLANRRTMFLEDLIHHDGGRVKEPLSALRRIKPGKEEAVATW